MKSLAKSLEHSQLQHLNLINLQLQVDSATLLSEGLQHSKFLKSLQISQTEVSEKCLEVLLSFIPPTLARLDLSYCHLSDKAGHVLCKMIKTQSEQLDEQKWALSLRAQTKLEKLIAAQQQRGLTELVLHHN
jgi:hypothetical protein